MKSIEPFITGFIENNNYVGRPADVEFVKDGSMRQRPFVQSSFIYSRRNSVG